MKNIKSHTSLLAFVIIFFSAILLYSCKNNANLKPSPSGAAFELLYVINPSDTAAATPLTEALLGPVPYLPQPEPQFRLSRIDFSMYDRLLQTTRNILFVSVDPERYTQGKVVCKHDLWANSQAVCYVNAPSKEELNTLLSEKSEQIVNFFVKAERERMHNYYVDNINKTANYIVDSIFGINIAIPTSMNKYKYGNHFLWISNGSATSNQNIVVYTTPYKSVEQLSNEALLARRDSVMQANIPGELPGSYMGTELKHLFPATTFINHNGKWAAETRGLWRMQNGTCMGGPFVALTTIDEIHQQILTIEGFVYAPSRDKRNLLRQMDAMVYSLIIK